MSALSDKAWDVATKLLVPVSIAIGAAIINHEVRLTRLETKTEGGVVGKADLSKVEKTLDAIDNRTRDIEKTVIKLEAKLPGSDR